MVENIAGFLNGLDPTIERRQIEHFTAVDPEYGSKVAAALGL